MYLYEGLDNSEYNILKGVHCMKTHKAHQNICDLTVVFLIRLDQTLIP